MGKFSVKIYIDINDHELSSEWKNLYQNTKVSSFFSSYEWNYNLAKFIYQNSNSYFLMIKNKNEAIAIIPFFVKKTFGIKSLNTFGDILSDYSTVLFKSKIFFQDFDLDIEDFLIKKIKIKNFIFFKLKIEEENVLKIIFPKMKTFILDKYCSYQRKISFINSDFNSLKKRVNSDTRRCLNQIKTKGKLTFYFDVVDYKNKNDIFLTTIKNKSKQYLRSNQRNIFNEQKYFNFYKSIFFLDSPNISLSCLKLNDEIISSHIGFYKDDIFYYIFPSYNYKFNKFSPGKLLLEYLFKSLNEKKINIFDFTIGDERYKEDWSDIKSNLNTLASDNFSFRYILQLIQSLRRSLSKVLILRLIYLKLKIL